MKRKLTGPGGRSGSAERGADGAHDSASVNSPSEAGGSSSASTPAAAASQQHNHVHAHAHHVPGLTAAAAGGGGAGKRIGGGAGAGAVPAAAGSGRGAAGDDGWDMTAPLTGRRRQQSSRLSRSDVGSGDGYTGTGHAVSGGHSHPPPQSSSLAAVQAVGMQFSHLGSTGAKGGGYANMNHGPATSMELGFDGMVPQQQPQGMGSMAWGVSGGNTGGVARYGGGGVDGHDRKSDEEQLMGASIDLLLRVSGDQGPGRASELSSLLMDGDIGPGHDGGGGMRPHAQQHHHQQQQVYASMAPPLPSSGYQQQQYQQQPAAPFQMRIHEDRQQLEIAPGIFVSQTPPAGVAVTAGTRPDDLSPYPCWRLTFPDEAVPMDMDRKVNIFEANEEGLFLFGGHREHMAMYPSMHRSLLWIHPEELAPRSEAARIVAVRRGGYSEWPGRYVRVHYSDASLGMGPAVRYGNVGGTSVRLGAHKQLSVAHQAVLVPHYALFRAWERIFIDYYPSGAVKHVLAIFTDVEPAPEELSEGAVKAFHAAAAGAGGGSGQQQQPPVGVSPPWGSASGGAAAAGTVGGGGGMHFGFAPLPAAGSPAAPHPSAGMYRSGTGPAGVPHHQAAPPGMMMMMGGASAPGPPLPSMAMPMGQQQQQQHQGMMSAGSGGLPQRGWSTTSASGFGGGDGSGLMQHHPPTKPGAASSSSAAVGSSSMGMSMIGYGMGNMSIGQQHHVHQQQQHHLGGRADSLLDGSMGNLASIPPARGSLPSAGSITSVMSQQQLHHHHNGHHSGIGMQPLPMSFGNGSGHNGSFSGMGMHSGMGAGAGNSIDYDIGTMSSIGGDGRLLSAELAGSFGSLGGAGGYMGGPASNISGGGNGGMMSGRSSFDSVAGWGVGAMSISQPPSFAAVPTVQPPAASTRLAGPTAGAAAGNGFG